MNTLIIMLVCSLFGGAVGFLFGDLNGSSRGWDEGWEAASSLWRLLTEAA